MKRIFSILQFACLWLFSQGQLKQPDSWTIKWNKKILLQTTKENEASNTKKIKQTDLSKNYFLELNYREADAEQIKELKRSFLFFDEADKELLRKDSTRSVKITAAELKKLFGEKKKIRIYTIAIPSDPAIAATVRVRRVHLCTLTLQ